MAQAFLRALESDWCLDIPRLVVGAGVGGRMWRSPAHTASQVKASSSSCTSSPRSTAPSARLISHCMKQYDCTAAKARQPVSCSCAFRPFHIMPITHKQTRHLTISRLSLLLRPNSLLHPLSQPKARFRPREQHSREFWSPTRSDAPTPDSPPHQQQSHSDSDAPVGTKRPTG